MLQENSISEGKDSQVETFVEEQLNPDKGKKVYISFLGILLFF